MAETLKIVARINAEPGEAEGLVAEMKRLVKEVREEPGCLQYDLYRGSDKPDVLVFVEEWESRELWEAHMAGDALARFNERIGTGKIRDGEVHPLNRVI
ncbi:MAG: putative quinol monooxygenase [Geminicoccaceae bacterium]